MSLHQRRHGKLSVVLGPGSWRRNGDANRKWVQSTPMAGISAVTNVREAGYELTGPGCSLLLFLSFYQSSKLD